MRASFSSPIRDFRGQPKPVASWYTVSFKAGNAPLHVTSHLAGHADVDAGIVARAAGPSRPILRDGILNGIDGGWSLARDCRIGCEATPVRIDIVLLHPEIGVALLELTPRWTADATALLRQRLELARFGAIFPGELPVAHLRLRWQDLAALPEMLAEAFGTQPPLSLPGEDAWTGMVRRALLGWGIHPAADIGLGAAHGVNSDAWHRPAWHRPEPPWLGGASYGWRGRAVLAGSAIGLVGVLSLLVLPRPEAAPRVAPVAAAEAGSVHATPTHPQWAVMAAADAAVETVERPSDPVGMDPDHGGATAGDPGIMAADRYGIAELPWRHDDAAEIAAALPPAVLPPPPIPALPPAVPLWAPLGAPWPIMASTPIPPAAPVIIALAAPGVEAPAFPAAVAPGRLAEHGFVAPAIWFGAVPPPPHPAMAEPAQPPSPPPPGSIIAAPRAPRADPVLLTALIRRGDALLAVGDISAARRFYERAAEAGSAAAAEAAGLTHDPARLATLGARGLRADPAAAAAWYQRAAAMRLQDGDATR